MSEPTLPSHTGWCVQENCAEGEHRGRLVRLEPVASSPLTDVITVQLVQLPGELLPVIEMTATSGTEPLAATWHLMIDVAQSRELEHVLHREVSRAFRATLAEARRHRMTGAEQ